MAEFGALYALHPSSRIFSFIYNECVLAPLYEYLIVTCFVEAWRSCYLFVYDSQDMEAITGCWLYICTVKALHICGIYFGGVHDMLAYDIVLYKNR